MNFLAKNKVLIIALIGALITVITPYATATSIPVQSVSLAALIAVLGVFANQWKGQGASILGVLGSVSGSVADMLTTGHFTWIAFGTTTAIALGGFFATSLNAHQTGSGSGASFGSASIAKMLLFLVGMTFLASAASAQSFFHRLPKIQPAYLSDAPRKVSLYSLGLTAPSTDSTMNAIRPITIAAAYSEPGNILMAGAGLSYQHLTYSTSTGLWSCQWSVSAIGFAGGSVAPSTPASIMSVGVLGGFLNNLVEIGPCYNFGTKQVGVAVALGINFNN